MEKIYLNNKLPLPTPKQEEWANMEMGVLIHHCMETYHPDLPPHLWKCAPDQMPAESFAPTDENTDQWIEAAVKMGAGYAVLVTNHVTGFSMWPTAENSYSIASSPYKDGKADIVKDFIASCKKYGVRPGLYYSTGCNGYCGINDGVKQDYQSPEYQKYVKMVERQLMEIWGNYGELYELWFDGGIVPHELGGPDVKGLVQKYQPNAICFQGPVGHHQNLRWVGNERGVAPMDCWSTTFEKGEGFGGDVENDAVGIGSPRGTSWIPAETDMGNRKQNAFGGGWAWAEGEEHLVYSPEELFDCYITSVGRNTNLLMGMCISQRGHFEDTEQFERFGEMVREMYSNPAASTRGIGREFELVFEEAEDIRWFVAMEDIHYGERVRKFHLDVTAEDGTTETVFEAHCIGHKRIVPLHRRVKSVKLVIDEAADEPILRDMTLYR